MARFLLTAQLQLRAPANTRQVVAQMQRQLRGVNVPVNVNAGLANTQMRQLTSNVNAANSAGQRMNRTFATSVRRFAAFSVASRAITLFTTKLTSGITAAIDFERELVKISQVSGKTLTELQGLASTITDLSTSLGTSSKALLSTGRILAQAGIQARDLDVALAALAKTTLAPTFDDITKTAEGAVAILAQFGEGVGALEKQLGAINAVAGQFAVESGDLISAVRRTGGVFKSAGGDLNELIGLFTSVRATTRESAESIATGLRTIFTRIQRPKTIEFLKQFGVQLTDLEGKFVGPFEAVKRLSSVFKSLEEGDITFVRVAEELGGFRQIGKVIPLLQQFEIAEKARAAAVKGATSLDRDAATAQQSLAVQIEKTREKFLELVRDIAGTGTFKALVASTLSLADAFIKVADSLKPIIPLIGALAGAKVIGALGGFARGIGASIRTRNSGGPIGFNSGGLVPGTGTTDTVPARLTPGEFVIKKNSVRKIGVDNLHALNAKGYNVGGRVEAEAGSYPDTRGYAVPSKYVFNKESNAPFDKSINRFNTEDKIRFRRLPDDRVDVNAEFPGASKNSTLYKQYAAAVKAGNNAARGNAFEKIIEAKRGVSLAIKNRGESISDAPSSRLDGIKTQGNYPIEIKSIAEILSDRELGKKVSGASLNSNPSTADAKIKKRLELQRLTNSKKTKKPDIVNLGPVQVVADVTNLGAIKGNTKDTRILGQPRTRNTKEAPFTANTGGGVPGSAGSVPALLTPGEFVLGAGASKRIGLGNLHRMNSHGVAKFAGGGQVKAGRTNYGYSGPTGRDLINRKAGNVFFDENVRKMEEEQKKKQQRQAQQRKAFAGAMRGLGLTNDGSIPRVIQKRIEQNKPKSPSAKQKYGAKLAQRGRITEARQEMRRQQSQKPLGRLKTGFTNATAAVNAAPGRLMGAARTAVGNTKSFFSDVKSRASANPATNAAGTRYTTPRNAVMPGSDPLNNKKLEDQTKKQTESSKKATDQTQKNNNQQKKLGKTTSLLSKARSSATNLIKKVPGGVGAALTKSIPNPFAKKPMGGANLGVLPGKGGGGGGLLGTGPKTAGPAPTGGGGKNPPMMGGGMGVGTGILIAASMIPRFEEADKGAKAAANSLLDMVVQLGALYMVTEMLIASESVAANNIGKFGGAMLAGAVAFYGVGKAIDSFRGVTERAERAVKSGDVAKAKEAKLAEANAGAGNVLLGAIGAVAAGLALFLAPTLAFAAGIVAVTALIAGTAKAFGVLDSAMASTRDFFASFGLMDSTERVEKEAEKEALTNLSERELGQADRRLQRGRNAGDQEEIISGLEDQRQARLKGLRAELELIQFNLREAKPGSSEQRAFADEFDQKQTEIKQLNADALQATLGEGFVQDKIRRGAATGNRVSAQEIAKMFGIDPSQMDTKEFEQFRKQVDDMSKSAELGAAQLRALNFGLSNVNAAANGAVSALDRFLESRGTGTFDAASVLEQALSSSAASLDPSELAIAQGQLSSSMRGFGASERQVRETNQTLSAINQAQRVGENLFLRAKEEVAATGSQNPEDVFDRFKILLQSQLSSFPADIRKRVLDGIGDLSQSDPDLIVEALASGDASGLLQTALEGPINAIKDGAINQQKQQQEINKKLAGLYKERIETERKLIEAQKKSLELQKESSELIAEITGKALTSSERVSFADRSARLGLGSGQDLSASGLVSRSAFSAQGAINATNAIAAGARDPNKRLTDQQSVTANAAIEQDRKTQEEILDYARERVKIYKDEIQAAKDKLKLEKEAANAFISGDQQAQFTALESIAAKDAFLKGNTGILRNISGEARSKAFDSLTDEEKQSAGVQRSLRSLGMTAELAKAASETTPEIQKLENEAIKMAQVIGRVGESLEKIAKNDFTQGTIDIQTATITISNGIARQNGTPIGQQQGIPQPQRRSLGGIIYANNGIFVPRGTDTVPAMLTPGEFVVNRAAVQRGNNLQILKAMNNGGAKATGYSRGGVAYLDEGAHVLRNTSNTSLSFSDGGGQITTGNQSSESSFEKAIKTMNTSMNTFSSAVDRLIGFDFKLKLDPVNVTVSINSGGLNNELKDQVLTAVADEIRINQLGQLERPNRKMGGLGGMKA